MTDVTKVDGVTNGAPLVGRRSRVGALLALAAAPLSGCTPESVTALFDPPPEDVVTVELDALGAGGEAAWTEIQFGSREYFLEHREVPASLVPPLGPGDPADMCVMWATVGLAEDPPPEGQRFGAVAIHGLEDAALAGAPVVREPTRKAASSRAVAPRLDDGTYEITVEAQREAGPVLSDPTALEIGDDRAVTFGGAEVACSIRRPPRPPLSPSGGDREEPGLTLVPLVSGLQGPSLT